jgi:3-oxoacyl-[acyl-carrier protein] reductase
MARAALDTPGVVSRVVRTMPLRQLGRAVDVARVCVALCSPAVSRHVSGQTITVAGGMEGRTLWDAGQIDEAAIRARARSDAD